MCWAARACRTKCAAIPKENPAYHPAQPPEVTATEAILFEVVSLFIGSAAARPAARLSFGSGSMAYIRSRLDKNMKGRKPFAGPAHTGAFPDTPKVYPTAKLQQACFCDRWPQQQREVSRLPQYN
jgi:hypothetical protein